MLDLLLGLIFPPKCIFCNGILPVENKLEICSECFGKIPFVENRRFGGLNKGIKCRYCDEVICVCEYSGIIKDAIIRYKFFNKSSYYRAFAGLLSNKVKEMTNYRNFDIIISVPLHKSKERTRGYNQSYLISKMLSRETGIREESGALSRVRNTGSQSLIASREDRYRNVRDAFKVTCPDKVRGKAIILVDDILTTGYTIEECGRVLLEAGARNVTAAVVASGRKY